MKTFNNISVTGLRHAIIQINHKLRTHLKQTNLFSMKNTSQFTKHVSYRQYDPCPSPPPPSKKFFKASFPNRTYLKMIAHFTVTYCNDSCTRIIFFWILNRYSKSTCSLPQWKKIAVSRCVIGSTNKLIYKQ